jgi:hypothetical protein
MRISKFIETEIAKPAEISKLVEKSSYRAGQNGSC